MTTITDLDLTHSSVDVLVALLTKSLVNLKDETGEATVTSECGLSRLTFYISPTDNST